MDDKNFKYLKEQLQALGFPSRIAEEASQYMQANKEAFHIYYFHQIKEDELMYDLHFTTGSNNYYQLKEYELTYKHIKIPDLNIEGISTKTLDERLKEVNGLYDKYYDGSMENNMSGQEYEQATDFIKATNNDLYKLVEVEEGKDVAKLLMYKYFPESEYQKIFPDYKEMQKLQEHKYMFPVNDSVAFTAVEAYQFLKQESSTLAKENTNSITVEQDISEEVINQINSELLEGNQWIAYNTASYFLRSYDVYFFNNKDEATEFAEGNISEYDNYHVIKATSVSDVLKQIPDGEQRLKLFADSIINEQKENQTNSFTQKSIFMNQKNFDYLKDQVKFTGFGDGLENELKENMQKQQPEFQIMHNAKFGNDVLTAYLHFKKSDQTDMYFFNRYQVSLTPEQSKDKMEQTFYINKEGSITLKEAYNLMNRRSVNKDLTNKEGQVYNAWMQMDFKQTDNNGNYKLKQFHQNYGYDLVTALEKHPIKELTNEQDKTRLVESLQKGNRQSVTFEQNGNQQKHFIEANPQFKTINIYDSNMQRLNSKQGQNEKQGQGEHNSTKQTSKNENQKQSDANDSDEMPKASNKRRKKQSNSIS